MTPSEARLDGLRVVVARPLRQVSQDTRLHNVAWSLAAAGADVTVVHLTDTPGGVDEVDDRGVRWMGAPTQRLHLGVAGHHQRDRRNWRPIGPNAGRDSIVAARRRILHRRELDTLVASGDVSSLERLRLRVHGRWLRTIDTTLDAQDRAAKSAWEKIDAFQRKSTVGASWRRQVPDLYAFEQSLAGRIDNLKPDVVHAHDLTALGLAVRAKWRARRAGRSVKVVFDAIEDWAGLPQYGSITPRYLAAMLQHEAEYIGGVDAMTTVSQTVANAIAARHPKAPRAELVMNCPAMARQRPASSSVREAFDVPSDAPLMIYSGGINPARGVDVSIDALPFLPGWYLGVVAVPYPHALMPSLTERAEALGVADRLRWAPPVPGPEIVDYLVSADIGLIPASTQFANLLAGMPNKLFEYIQAGLPVITSNLPELAAYIATEGVGEEFTYPSAEGLAAAVQRAHERFPAGLDLEALAPLLARASWEHEELTLLSMYGRLVESRP